MNPSELVQKLPGPLLRSISLSNLNKANITSLEQVQNKTWSRSQVTLTTSELKWYPLIIFPQHIQTVYI